MNWTLVERWATTPDAVRHKLRSDQESYICLGKEDRLSITNTLPEKEPLHASPETENLRAAAAIAVGGWGVRLEAYTSLIIYPANPRTNSQIKPPQEQYILQSVSDQFKAAGKYDVIFLRADDKIAFRKGLSLTLEYDPPEVQVNSSVEPGAEVAEIPESEDQGAADGECPKEHELAEPSETDDDDLDNTITVPAAQGNELHSRATPNPSIPRSQIIEETPTVHRTHLLTEYPTAEEQAIAPEAVAISGQQGKSTPNEPFDQGNANDAATRTDKVTSTIPDFHSSINASTGSSIPELSKKPDTNTLTTNITKDPTEEPAETTEQPAVREQLMTPVKAEEDSVMTGNEEQATTIARSPVDEAAADSGYGDRDAKIVTPILDLWDSDTPPEPKHATPEAKGITHESPVVSIPRPSRVKRRSIEFEDDPSSMATPPRSSKRAKKADGSIIDRNTITKEEPVKHEGRSDTDEIKTEPELSASPADDGDIYHGSPPKVAFSNSAMPDMPMMMRFFKQKGCSKVETVKSGKCDLLCVREGALRKSMKLLLCITLGIPVVTDAWLQESSRKGQLLDTKRFMPQIPDQEKEWNFSLARVWGQPQPAILDNRVVYFTAALRKIYAPFDEVETICKALGCASVPKIGVERVKDDAEAIFLGQEDDDPECATLLENGRTVYSKDLLTLSILRGEFDLNSDEFKIKPGGSQRSRKSGSKDPASTKKRGRPKK